MTETTVVGGGIVGASVAYHLAREGVETTLIDRGDEGRATDAGAGIVAPGTSGRPGDDPWYDLATAAADHYPDLVDRLRREQDGDPGYERCDYLDVAMAADEVAAFDETGRAAPGIEGVMEVSPRDAREAFPPLEEPLRARRYRGVGRVNGRLVTAALRRAGEAHGLTVESGDVEAIRVSDGAVSGVAVDGEFRRAGAVVVAGGAWSPAFADDLGVDVAVEPQRGQIAHLDVGDADTGSWPIVSAFREHYLVPFPGGRVVAGATRERGVGFDPRATAGGVREVLDEALRVAPGLADAELLEVRVGLRPLSADGLPLLGAVPGASGAYLATGHGPSGLTLGPYSGRCVAALVRGAEPPTDLSAFDPARLA
ncbi:MAG: NAD(P)/FAD-dependent oxidoreductase [Halobacteriaceae archaeon]